MWTEMVDGLTVHQFYEIVQPWRDETELAIAKVLSALDPTFESRRRLFLTRHINLALLHHSLYMARRAHELGRPELARESLKIWELTADDVRNVLVTYKDKQWLMLDSSKCLLANFNQNFETECFTVTDEALTAEQRVLPNEYLHTAWQLAERTGLFFFLEVASSVIIHLQWRDLEDSTTCYTLSPFPGTVYTDWTDAPLRYAEALIHESAHSWLNMYLASQSVEIKPTGRTWYSPWRNAQRPALGIVHGAFAFSVVYSFYKRLAANDGYGLLPEKQIQYCRDRRDYELQRLREVEHVIEDALSEINNPAVHQLVMTWYPGPKQFELYRNG